MNKVKSVLLTTSLLFISQAFVFANGYTVVDNNRNPVSCNGGPWVVRTPFCGSIFNPCVSFAINCNSIKIKYAYNGEYNTLNDQNKQCNPNKIALYRYVTVHRQGLKDTYDLRFDKCLPGGMPGF